MKRFLLTFISIYCISASFISCKKDKLLTDSSAKISFSQDSVLFDTVFTTIGSATRNIRIINNNKQKIKISSLTLEKGSSSQFILNVDGVSGNHFSDIEIDAHDSIYVFIQVNVNPTNALSPLIIQDKIVLQVNGNEQSLALEAWGQDAHYHLPDKAIQFKNGYLPYSIVSASNNTVVTWGGGALGQPDDDKPHVIYGWLVVDSTQTLVINKGVKVYFHQNAGLWVYRYGTLQVKGQAGQEVTFQGDRRESDYADLPGQWDRIWINEGSVNNSIDYAIIKNGYIGVQASLYPFFVPPNSIYYDSNAPKKLKITNTIIKNCSSWGIYAQSFHVFGGNDVVVNCKDYCGVFSEGGNYTFIQSTFANFFNQDGGRSGKPCVHIDNYRVENGVNKVLPLDSAFFGNCIIHGSQGNELELDIKTGTSNPTNYKFSYSLIQTTNNMSDPLIFDNCKQSLPPDFKNIASYDFSLGNNSNAINMGNGAMNNIAPYISFLNADITGSKFRNSDGSPDAGAYEK